MILKGTPATISITFLDGDEVADPGVVNVTIDRADGTELVPETAASGTGEEERTFALTASQTAQVDILTATWVSPTLGTGVTYHPIVGGFYVDLGTLRNAGDLSDQSRFPDEVLDAARDWWLALVDDYCDQSFVPMFRLEEQWWRGGRLRLDRPHVREVLSASIGGTAVDTSGWVATPTGRVYTSAGANPSITAPGLLRIGYEHGHDYPDRELYDAGLRAMRAKLLEDRTGRPSRSLVISNEFGTQRESRPGDGRATGYPDVDAVLNRRRASDILVA